MNCSQCGGPLKWESGLDAIRCGYCGCVAQLETATETVDRYQWLGSSGTHDCPNCEQLLESAILERMPIESCRECLGILVPTPVLAIVVRQRREAFQGATRAPKLFSRDSLLGSVKCPGCRQRMDRDLYGGGGNEVIDSCPRCELAWLDNGELASIESAPGCRGA